MMKLRSTLILAATLLAASASAQVANISTTAASSFAGLNLTTTMQNAVASTAFSNDGLTMLHIKTGGTATNATVVTQATQMSQNGYGITPLTNLVVAVPANTYMLLGPFPQGRWNSQQGTVVTNLSAVTGVSVSAVSVAQ